MSEHEARSIADELVGAALGHVPPCEGAHYEGGSHPEWTVHYRTPTKPNEVIDPATILVVVDVETRVAKFFPLI